MTDGFDTAGMTDDEFDDALAALLAEMILDGTIEAHITEDGEEWIRVPRQPAESTPA